MKRQAQRKRIALLLSVLAAVSFVLLLAFSVHEAGHACTGRDCAVCELIACGGKTLKETLIPKPAAVKVKTAGTVPVQSAAVFSQVSYFTTHVQKKCRMNL